MRPISDLDPVIRRVEEPSEDSVTLDLEGKPLNGLRRWLPWIGRNHFLVTTSRDRKAVARSSFETVVVSDSSDSGWLEVSIDYELRCPRGNELKAARGLFEPEASLQEALDSKIGQWLDEIAASRLQELLIEEGVGPATIAAELGERAASELGLKARFTLRIEHSDRLEQLPLSIQGIETELLDLDEKIDFDTEIKLGVISDQELMAYGQPLDIERERRQLRRIIGEFVASSVTLHEFQTELKSSVTKRLVARLNERFRSQGRQVDRLILDAQPFEVNELVDHEVEVKIQPREFPRTIQIQSHALLELHDTGQYFREGRPEILGWLEANVAEIVTEALFGLSFEELWKVHEARKKYIESRLEERVREIGYRVRQITTITDLEAELLKDSISVRVEGEFGTRLANYAVGLEIHADATLRSREHIPELLTRYKNVRESMERELRQAIEKEMRNLDPEVFYIAFETALDPKDRRRETIGGKSVRDYLESIVRGILSERFECEVSSFSCRQCETELSKFYERLLRQKLSLKREIFFDVSEPALTFEGRFRVRNVHKHGWHDFRQAQPFELQDLELSLADSVAEQLREIGFREAFQATPKELKALTTEAGASVRREYGLEVEITFLDKMELGNAVLTEKGSELWPLQLATRIEVQKHIEFGLRDLAEEHVSLLLQGHRDEARVVKRTAKELGRQQDRNLLWGETDLPMSDLERERPEPEEDP